MSSGRVLEVDIFEGVEFVALVEDWFLAVEGD